MEVREASVEYSVAADPRVPAGYKQTEVGVIPNDWATVTLFALAGGTKERFDDGDWIEAEFLTESGIRLIQTGNIGIGVFIDKESKKYISPRSFDLLRCKALKVGDLLICRLAEPAGRACLFHGLEDDKAITAVDVTIFRPIEELADRRYLLQLFCTPSWFSAVNERCGGSTRTRIARGALGQIPIPLPPTKAEQEAIAEALSDADALIESLEQLLAKKRHLKQGAMQQLLTGKKRLPGFSGEWEVKRLGDVADTDPENLGSDTHPNFTFNYIALEDVDVGTLRSYSEQVFRTAPSRARRKLRKADVLVSTVRPNLMSHLLFPFDGERWVCSTGFCVVRCRLGVSHPGYVYFHMFAGGVTRQIEALLTGSNYPAINSGDVRALQIPFPEYEEQTAIATLLSDMDAELAALEAKLAKARAIKQGMMQELLTGRIRLV